MTGVRAPTKICITGGEKSTNFSAGHGAIPPSAPSDTSTVVEK